MVAPGCAKGRAGTKAPELGCQSEGAAWLVYCSASELLSSESMSGGSGLSKKDGRFFGMYFSPVKVNAPESLMNSVRVAMLLGVPRSSGRASSWFLFRSLALWVS